MSVRHPSGRIESEVDHMSLELEEKLELETKTWDLISI